MTVWELPALFVLSVLCGMKSVFGIKLWKGENIPFSGLWTEKLMYVLSGIWVVFYGLLWFGSGHSALLIRSVDVLCTCVILAAVDGRRRIVPDSILLCYFVGQMIWGVLSMPLDGLIHMIFTGVVFSVVMFAFAWFSRGKMGMGDARFLGVAAMTAGWSFVLQVLILAVALSFIYSVWLLIVSRKNMQTEFPFVPFLAMATVMHLAYFAFG